MIIVGFSNKTSKIIPRIFCRRFRHCAPIIIHQNGEMIMQQFIRHNKVVAIKITMRDLRILQAHDWAFVCLPCVTACKHNPQSAWTCVGLTCQCIGLRGLRPITPYGLYKKLKIPHIGGFF